MADRRSVDANSLPLQYFYVSGVERGPEVGGAADA
jgi:hypothetical protein